MFERGSMVLMLALILGGMAVVGRADVNIDDFEAREYTDAEGNVLRYRLFIPRNYDPERSYPLVFFMHGAGERGSDNRAQISIRSTRLWAEDRVQAEHPNFMVAPQVPTGQQWVNVPFNIGSHMQPKEPSEPMRLTLALLAALQEEFNIDADRLYATGLSMGGYGAWDVVTRHPEMFAAAVPICGGADPSKAPLIVNLPVWNFHGSDDPVVPVRGSREMIAALRDAGGEPLYTEYEGAGHNVWDRAYSEPELVPWMFSQGRRRSK